MSKKVKLGDIIKPRKEKVLPAEFPDMPFIGMEHVEAHTMRLLGTVPALTMKSAANRFYAGDVLYGRLRPYLNKVYKPHFDGLCSAEFIVFPKTEDIHPDFLRYRLNSQDLISFASHLDTGDRPRVNFDGLSSFEFFLPSSYEDQKRIVAEIEKQFSRLDEAVDSLKRIQANLKRYKAAVLKAAVEGKLTEEWRKNNVAACCTVGAGFKPAPTTVEPADQLLKRILAERRAKWEAEELAKMKAKGINPKDDAWKKKYKEPAGPDTANLPELPDGWVWARVEQLADIMLGKMLDKAKHLSGNKLPYLRNVNVRWGLIEINDLFEMFFEDSQLERYGLIDGDVLVCEGGEPGRAAVWNGKLPDMKYQKAIHRVRCCQGYEPRMLVVLLEHLAKSGRLEKWFTGSTIKHFTRESFVQLPVPMPSMSEQKAILEEINRRLSVTEELEATIETNLKRAERLRQTILQRAFSGGLP